MRKHTSNIALAIALVSLLLNGALIVDRFAQKKIAYVRSTELVYGYLGMQEAHNKYQEKAQIWQANIDTLQNDYNRAVGQYTREASHLSEVEKRHREKMLLNQQENLMSYSRAVNDKANEEDDKITEGVLNQVNSFVEGYGKDHGYDIILGTTLSGNLLYGKETIDITEEVLEALNKTYAGVSQ